jgi:maltose O-acetyltransferase
MRKISRLLLSLLMWRRQLIWRQLMRLGHEHRWMQQELLKVSLKKCGADCSFHLPLRIEGPEFVTFGSRVSIASYVHIWGQGGVEIGDDCMIASHVAISSITHNKYSTRYNEENIRRPVQIGSNVWIGSGAIILPGIRIGANTIVGAGAVVTSDLPPGVIAVGVPARWSSFKTNSSHES